MRPELAALVVHDLKNALGMLEARLAALAEQPEAAPAREAHRLCADMRSRFITFLTLYRADGEMVAHCEDESPRAFLDGLVRRLPRPIGAAPLTVGDCDGAPACWYFDFRLVRLALEAALHNAWRYARSSVVLGAREESGCLVLTVDDDGPGLGGAAGMPSETVGGAGGVGSDDAGGAVASAGTVTARMDAAGTTTGLGTELCRAVARAHARAHAHAHAGGADRPGGVRLFDRPEGGARFELWLA